MDTGLWQPSCRRLQVVLLLSFSFFCANLFVANFGLTLNYMVADQPQNATNSQCSHEEISEWHDYGGTLNWTRRQEDLLLSATPKGSPVAQLPSLWLTRRVPSSRILLFVMISHIIISLLIPFAAVYIGYYAVFILFTLVGVTHAFYPVVVFSLIDKWFPSCERSTALAILMMGVHAGGVVGGPITGLISTTWMGWQANYYFRSVLGIIFCVLWVFLGAESPRSCRIVSKEERCYLEEHVDVAEITKVSPPYRHILSSPAVWAEVSVNFASCMALVVVTSYFPRFFKEAVPISPLMKGIFVATSNFVAVLIRLFWSALVDSLKHQNILISNASVKLSQGISSGITVIFLIFMTFFVDCNSAYLALFFATVISGAQAMESAGRVTAMLSIAPQFNEAISTISLFFAQISRLGTPYMVTLLQHNYNDKWKPVFLATALLNIVAVTVFMTFGSGSEESWAVSKEKQNKGGREEPLIPSH